MTFGPVRSFSPHVRANHAKPPPPDAVGSPRATGGSGADLGVTGRSGLDAGPTGPADLTGPARTRPARAGIGRAGGVAGRLPGARAGSTARTLAAGGAVLAQVWGLGLGFSTAAHATTDTERRSAHADAPAGALLDGLTDTVAPVLDRSAQPVEQVLQDRIRAGGLPLPGQATTVPDAFAIATVLLPAVPPQSRADVPARASRSHPAGSEEEGADTAAPLPVVPVAGSGLGGPDASGPEEDLGTEVPDPGAVSLPGSGHAGAFPSGRAVTAVPPGVAQGLDGQDAPTDELALAAAPGRRGGAESGMAVLVPIVAGLLLTGAATYKHRGLPRGH